VNSWKFLTSHARVLLCIARDPGVRLRDVAAGLGITDATSQKPRGPCLMPEEQRATGTGDERRRDRPCGTPHYEGGDSEHDIDR
jgi:hypothetical protein